MTTEPKKWAGLVNIEVVSGTAQDGPEDFRGFVTVRAIAEDGSIMAGQLDPDELRAMALSFLSAAEAADQDALVFRVLTDRQARVAYGVEISPRYCDVICRRWQAFAGQLPVLERTGKTVDFGALGAG